MIYAAPIAITFVLVGVALAVLFKVVQEQGEWIVTLQRQIHELRYSRE